MHGVRFQTVSAILLLIPAALAQTDLLFRIDNCPAVSCAVDCSVGLDHAGCPRCICPLGRRCPVIVCPSSDRRQCRRVQKMDGCMTCLCESPLYSILDKNNNIETFLLDRPIPGSVERCRMGDVQVIGQCVKQLVQLQGSLRRAMPDTSSAVYPWFTFDRQQLSDFCNVMEKLPRCIGQQRMSRCRGQHSDLTYIMTMYSYPCLESRPEFFANFDCLHNVMVGHGRLLICRENVDAAIYKAAKAKSSFKLRQQQKCTSLNDFIDCTQPVISQHCGGTPAMLFHETVVKALGYIAPECLVDEKGRFLPKPLVDGVRGVSTVVAPAIKEALNALNQQNDTNKATLATLVNQSKATLASLLGHSVAASCHRIPQRISCPDGTRAQSVIRWYRQLGSSECSSYSYMYCGEKLEATEEPLRFEDQCYDECFREGERELLRESERRSA